MLVKIKKVLLDEQKVCINTPMNTQIHKIVADIFEFNFARYFENKNMRIDLEDVLFISDSNIRNYLDIPASYFTEFSQIQRTFGVEEDRILSIPSMNAYVFESKEYYEELLKDRIRPSIVILGFINNIPKSVLDNILMVFGRTKIFMFGDEIVSSPEFGDHFSTILTNSEYTINYAYSDYKNSIQKKINSVLSKLREKKFQNMAVFPVGTTTIKKTLNDNIDLDHINDSLNSDCNVVVPRRLLTQINSRVKNLFGRSSIISLEMGDVVYSRFPFITLHNEKPIVIPPLSRININMSDSIETIKDGRRIVLKNVTITKPNGTKVDLRNVPIDYTGYLMQFDESEHIDNYDDFEDIHPDEDPLYMEPSTLSIIPHRIMTNIEQKYIQSHTLVVFLESLDLDSLYTNRSLWYQDMMGVIENLEVISSNRFNEL